MTIILFLIDTSSSMNQRTYLGARPTLLEVAKDAVEKFLKSRQRDPASRGDRYMLLSFEDPPSNIKAGWKESHSVFMNELKHLNASGMTNMGSALKNAFDLLNLNRMQSGIDMYGLGRCPYYLEPSIIVVITDGSKLNNQLGVQDELILPMQSNVPGSELTREPFRWDQRLFSLVLRLTGAPPMDSSPNVGINSMPLDHSPIGAMCAVTSGRSYAVTSQRSLIQSIDALVQKVQSGVVIQFEKIGPDPPPIEDIDIASHNNNNNNIQSSDHIITNEPANNHHSKQPPASASNNATPSAIGNNGVTSILPAPNTSTLHPVPPPVPSVPPISTTFHHDQQQPAPLWHVCRSMIYVQRSAQKGFAIGHWPIPEAFWCDQNLNNLPPRTAHPIVKFTCVNTEPHVMDSLPFDKYELEVSPLTQYILSRKQPHVAWQVHISNSGRTNELGPPFGYLKAATNMACVNLFVMPYNYPVLLPILEELLKKPQPQHPSQHPNKQLRSEWRVAFDEYLKTMPPYYAGPLKRAMQRMGANSSLVPDSIEANCMSYSVHGHLKRLKNIAKAEFEKLVASVSQPRPLNIDTVRVLQCGNSLKAQVECTSYVNMRCTGRPSSSFYYRYATMKNELNEFTNFTIRIRDGASMSSNENLRSMQSYRNPYDIDRKDLIDQIYWMRNNFMQAPSRVKYRDEDQIHSLPVAQMGNYQDYLKKQPMPLRELESTPVRQHMFGNPFKIDKKGMMVDEADIDLASASPKNKKVNPNQRRRGPLPKDFMVSNSYSWTKSPSASPNPHREDQQNAVSQIVVIQNGSSLDLNSSPQQFLRPSTQDLEIRSEIFKLIRKPGLNFEPVLKQLSQLKGDKRKFLVEETITEAKKFKKASLVETLIQFMTD